MTASSATRPQEALPNGTSHEGPLALELRGAVAGPLPGRRARLWEALRAARRAPLLRDGGAVLVLALATLSLFWDAIARGQIAYENDTRIFYFPLFVRLGEAIKAGQLPLWSPQLFGGYPIFADGEAGTLYPFHLLALLVLPVETAFLWLRPVRFFQAAVFTYLFCRCIGVGRFGAIVGALTFAFGGFAIAQLHHTNISTAATWLPLALAFGELALRHAGRPRYAFALLAGVAFGLQGLILHIQVVLMSALAFTAYACYRALAGPMGLSGSRTPLGASLSRDVYQRPPPAGIEGDSSAGGEGRSPGSRPGLAALRAALDLGRRLRQAGLVVAIAGGTGAALAAVQLLPLYELGTFSFRGVGVDYAYSSQYSLPPVQLLSLFLPDFFVVNGQYWGLWSRWEVFAYAGLAPMLLAVIGVLLTRHWLMPFFLALAAFALAVALGEHSPGEIHRLLSALPGFSVLRAPGRFIFLFTLSLAMLAALGADALRRELAPERERSLPLGDAVRQAGLSLVILACGLAAMIAPLALALGAVYVETHKPETIAWLQRSLVSARGFDPRWSVEQLYQFVLAAVDVTQPSTLRQLVILLAVASVLFLWDRLRVLGNVWQVSLVLLIAVDLIGVGWRFHPVTPFSALAAPSGVAAYLEANPGLYRVFSQKGTRDEPNRLLGFRVAEANGYSSLEPERHQAFVARLEYAPNRLLDLFNVRYRVVKNEFVPAQSFNLTSYDPRRPLLSSTGRNPAGFGAYRLEDVLADTLRVVSTVRWGSTLAQGTPLARLTATDSSGKAHVFQMLAGVHTAEWAWERPDLRGKVPHQLPKVARTWQQRDGAAPPYPAHYYYAEFPLEGSVRLRRLEVQFLHPTAQVEIYGIAAYNDATNDLEQVQVGGHEKFIRVYADSEVVLYENRDYLPRAYLVPSAVVERPGDEILHRLAMGDFQPERMVILEEQFDVSKLPPPPPPGSVQPIRSNLPQGTESTSEPGTVRILRMEDDLVLLDAAARQNAMLFLADLAYPGWKAYLDGKETPIYRANFLFRAVYVPAGRHTVEFVYRPRSFRLGLLVTLVATLGVIGGLAWLSFRRATPWPLYRAGASIDYPSAAPSDAATASADGPIPLRKGAQDHARQEPEGDAEKADPEKGSGEQEAGEHAKVVPPSTGQAEATPGRSDPIRRRRL